MRTLQRWAFAIGLGLMAAGIANSNGWEALIGGNIAGQALAARLWPDKQD